MGDICWGYLRTPPTTPVSLSDVPVTLLGAPVTAGQKGGGGWKMDARDPQVGASQFPLLCRHQMLEPLYHPFEGRNRGMLLLEEVVA